MDDASNLISLAGVLLLGIGAQWLAWRLHLPSILLLLGVGLIVGPGTELAFGASGRWLAPDVLLGRDVLFPFVSLSVALILYEGGLSLRFRELQSTGGVVFALISIGALVTWVITSLAGHYLVGMNWGLATLLGALLVVTGPTVIQPLLWHVRPKQRVSTTLKWESILIDPIGVVLAVLILEALLADAFHETPLRILLGAIKALLVGTFFGVAAAVSMIQLFRRHWVPEHLQNAVSVMFVIGSAAASNWLSHESGLVAVTVLGVAMANQRSTDMRRVVEFKENLRVLLLGSLFVLLAARLDLASLESLGWGSLGFVAALVFIARPLSVFASTLFSSLSWNERMFLAWIAPRGIVAAAISSLFALRLVDAGYEDAAILTPLTFLVIVSTVLLAGLTAAPVARALGVSQDNPQGVLMVGAHRLSRAMGEALKQENLPLLLVDTNRGNLIEARMLGLPTYHGNVLAPGILEDLELVSIGRALAMTGNDEANALIAQHCAERFGSREVYQLQPQQRHKAPAPQSEGRILFGSEHSYESLLKHFDAGAVVKRTKLTKEFDYSAFREHYEDNAVMLFAISPKGSVKVATVDSPITPEPGTTLIFLLKSSAVQAEAAASQDASDE